MSATKLKQVDVVVVGSGVVGSIMSMELASAGMSVVCLERGRSIDVNTDFHKPDVYDELKFDRHSDIFQNLARDTLTFRNTDSQTALPMREMGAFKPGEMVGGTVDVDHLAAHWTETLRLAVSIGAGEELDAGCPRQASGIANASSAPNA